LEGNDGEDFGNKGKSRKTGRVNNHPTLYEIFFTGGKPFNTREFKKLIRTLKDFA